MTGHISPNQLITQSLETLSKDLSQKLETHLSESQKQQQHQINQALTKLIPTLLEQLLPIIRQEVNKQNQTMLTQVATCLSELESTNKQQLEMLKLGREEYQHLQNRMKSTLTELDQLSLLDDEAVKNSLSGLQKSITSLQTQMTVLQESQQSMSKEQAELGVLIDDLKNLKLDMTTTLNSLKQQQESLAGSLELFAPLLKA